MKVFHNLPSKRFTKVPNELLTCEFLTPANKLTWIQLASVCREGAAPKHLKSIADIANEIGESENKLRTAAHRLYVAGGISKHDGAWELVIPTEKPPEETIADEVDGKKNRKHNISQEEAWELFKEAWNKNKPEAWLRLDGRKNLPLMIAFETHTKRLDIEREDYGRFVAQICRGASVDPWWSTYNAKASSVFGFNKVQDKKFENVEKLYKYGANVEPEVDYTSDATLLKPYHKRADRTDLVNVKRILVKDREEAVRLDSEIEKVPATAYFYFVEGQDKPVAWSNDFKFPYCDFFQE